MEFLQHSTRSTANDMDEQTVPTSRNKKELQSQRTRDEISSFFRPRRQPLANIDLDVRCHPFKFFAEQVVKRLPDDRKGSDHGREVYCLSRNLHSRSISAETNANIANDSSSHAKSGMPSMTSGQTIRLGAEADENSTVSYHGTTYYSWPDSTTSAGANVADSSRGNKSRENRSPTPASVRISIDKTRIYSDTGISRNTNFETCPRTAARKARVEIGLDHITNPKPTQLMDPMPPRQILSDRPRSHKSNHLYKGSEYILNPRVSKQNEGDLYSDEITSGVVDQGVGHAYEDHEKSNRIQSHAKSDAVIKDYILKFGGKNLRRHNSPESKLQAPAKSREELAKKAYVGSSQKGPRPATQPRPTFQSMFKSNLSGLEQIRQASQSDNSWPSTSQNELLRSHLSVSQQNESSLEAQSKSSLIYPASTGNCSSSTSPYHHNSLPVWTGVPRRADGLINMEEPTLNSRVDPPEPADSREQTDFGLLTQLPIRGCHYNELYQPQLYPVRVSVSPLYQRQLLRNQKFDQDLDPSAIEDLNDYENEILGSSCHLDKLDSPYSEVHADEEDYALDEFHQDLGQITSIFPDSPQYERCGLGEYSGVHQDQAPEIIDYLEWVEHERASPPETISDDQNVSQQGRYDTVSRQVASEHCESLRVSEGEGIPGFWRPYRQY